MPIHMNELVVGSGADVYLHVKTARAGKIKGESTAGNHVNDIEVRGWSWGVHSPTAVGSIAATGRRQYRWLTVYKGIDSASTGLMSSLVTNDEVKELTLAMHKGGGEPLDYFRMMLAGCRVVDVDITVDAEGRPTEKVMFAFTKIDIEYHPQQGSGAGGGATSFTDEVLPK